MLRVSRSLDDAGLTGLVAAQLNNMFPDGEVVDPAMISSALPMALERLEHCFSQINNKYFFDGTTALFSHLHGDQYAMFLYLLANSAYRQGLAHSLASKLFLLNKALHGVDAYYEVELPSIFLFVHPLATVLGRGRYADYFMVYQRCGVGSNHDVYPTLGEHLTLRPGSAVLGRCKVGGNCTIAAESLLLDADLPDHTVYIGNPRDFTTRASKSTPSIWRSQAINQAI